MRLFGRRWWRDVISHVLLAVCCVAIGAFVTELWIQEECWWLVISGKVVTGRIVAYTPKHDTRRSADVVIEYAEPSGGTYQIRETWQAVPAGDGTGHSVGVYLWNRNLIVRAASRRHPAIELALAKKRSGLEGRSAAGPSPMVPDRALLKQLDPSMIQELKRMRDGR